MTKATKLISPAILLLASAIWGFAFVAQDNASAVPPFTVGALRSVIAALLLVAITVAADRLRGGKRRLFSRRGIDVSTSELIGGIICGTVLAVASALQQIGISQGTGGGKAAFITALYVVLVPIYSLTLGKRAPLNVWLSVAGATVGFYLLCIDGSLTILPSDLAVVACALVFPVHILVTDRFGASCDPIRLSAVQFLVCAFLNGAAAVILESDTPPDALLSALPSILYLGVFSSAVAYTLQIVGQRGTEPAAASIILSLESVFGIIGATVMLGEYMEIREYIGCAIILGAVILSQINPFVYIKREKGKEPQRNDR